MNINPIQPHLSESDIPLERLAGDSQLTEDQKIGEVTRQVEAILLRQILQNTQKTIIPSEFSDNSTAASIYHDLVTEQLADSISKSGTLGLAKTLHHQLSHQLHPASTAGHDCKPLAQPTAHAGTNVARPSSCSANQSLPVSTPKSPGHGSVALTPHERTAAKSH